MREPMSATTTVVGLFRARGQAENARNRLKTVISSRNGLRKCPSSSFQSTSYQPRSGSRLRA